MTNEIVDNNSIANEESLKEKFEYILEECYILAEEFYNANKVEEIKDKLGSELFDITSKLAEVKHAARGVVLTLTIYKLAQPEQDIRRHKSEFPGGFSARVIDNAVTVPFLERHSLPYNVESHWLTQTFSFAGPLEKNLELKTVPKIAGPYAVAIVNTIEEAQDEELIKWVAVLLLAKLVEVRNKGHVALTKPKNLSIDQVMELLKRHFSYGYQKNTPRLPQLALYAMYMCLMRGMNRYSRFELKPLERLKTANRKSGSVGDIDISLDGRPIEAVEVKYEIPISQQHVAEAIQKIKTESVERYFILSTKGINMDDETDIKRLKEDFLKSNGCEIIVNGVYETIKYYLRLLQSTNDFINNYTELLEKDIDLDYEHKLAWNEICSTR